MWYPSRTGSAEGSRGSYPVDARASCRGTGYGLSWSTGNPADLQLELASPVVVGFVLQSDGRACSYMLRVICYEPVRTLQVASSGRSWALNEKKYSPS